MKKVVLSLAVLFTVALVSCSGNKKEAAVDSDSLNLESNEAVLEEETAQLDSQLVKADSALEAVDSAKEAK